MSQPLRVLIAEDNPMDAKLVVRELQRAGYVPDWKCVDSESAFLDELRGNWDIILSDFIMPQFGGLRALELLKKSGLNIPFIIISGTVGEDEAVGAMKLGASDYLLKDRMARLGPAVNQVMEQYRLRRERKAADEALLESERRFSDMLRNVELISIMLDKNAQITYCNDFLLHLTGWRREELIGQDWIALLLPPEIQNELHGVFKSLLQDMPSAWHFENAILTRNGARRTIFWNNTVLRSITGDAIGTSSIGEDITERKQAEDALRKRADELEQFHRLSVGRELQMIELKKEINERARRAGENPPFDLSFLDESSTAEKRYDI